MTTLIQRLVAILAVVSLAAGCSDQSQKSAFFGAWEDPNDRDRQVSFSTGGDFMYLWGDGRTAPWEGRFVVVDRSVVEITNPECGAAVGVYRGERNGDDLRISLVEDACSTRRSVLPGRWTDFWAART